MNDRSEVMEIDQESAPVLVLTGNLNRGRKAAARPAQPVGAAVSPGQPPRLALLLALARKWQAMLDRGEVKGQQELAGRLCFTRARITQIMDLNLLAPDIQEDILTGGLADGRKPLTERALRIVLRAGSWVEQRRVWAAVSVAP